MIMTQLTGIIRAHFQLDPGNLALFFLRKTHFTHRHDDDYFHLLNAFYISFKRTIKASQYTRNGPFLFFSLMPLVALKCSRKFIAAKGEKEATKRYHKSNSNPLNDVTA